MIPGWTTATRFSRSISMMRSIAVNAIVRPPSIPDAPPDSPVPAPRGTIGTRSSPAIRTSSATWAVVVGRATARGQAGVEVGGLVVAVALAVEGVGQQPEVREAARDRGRQRIGGGRVVGGSMARGHAPQSTRRGRRPSRPGCAGGWPAAARPDWPRGTMAPMPRRASLIVAAILAAGGFALPSPSCRRRPPSRRRPSWSPTPGVEPPDHPAGRPRPTSSRARSGGRASPSRRPTTPI